MEQLIAYIAQKTGLPAPTVQQGILALVGVLRKHVGEETFTRFAAMIPGGSDLLATPATVADSGGGLFGSLLGGMSGMMGGMMGGKAAILGEAAGALQGAGVDLEQAMPFAQAFFEKAKEIAPPEAIEMLLAKMPELAEFQALKS